MASGYPSSDHGGRKSDIEGDPTPLFTLSDLSWWSDSNGHLSRRSSADEESPWWESDKDDKRHWESKKDSPIPPPVFGGNVSSPSSVTPSWWSEPSSRHLSTSGTEVEVNPLAEHHIGEGGQESGANDEGAISIPKKNRKRLREQSNVLGADEKEPPINRLKFAPLPPDADLATVANDIKIGIVEPLQIFLLFFTVDVLKKICDLTNTRAWEVVLINPAFANDDGAWEDITVREMQIFIAIIQIMRRHPDVGFGSFWREERVGEHWPRTLMKRSRFFAIIQLLTVVDPLDIQKTSHIQDSSSPEAKKIGQRNSQSGRIPDKSDHFLYFFYQIKTVLKTFQRNFNIQFAEKIFNREVSAERVEILNYLKVVSSTCRPSDATKNQGSTLPDFKLVPNFKSDVLKSSEVLSQAHSLRPSNGFVSVNEQESSKDSKEFAERPNSRPGVTGERPVLCDNGISDHLIDLNVLNLEWHDGTLNVTADNGRSESSACEMVSGSVTVEDAPDPSLWKKVFLPCPEVIYKDARSTKDDADVAQDLDRPSNPPLAKSFFYHYLNLAHFFSTTEAFLRPESACSVQTRELLSADLADQIIDGLVSLGDAGSISQSDSDSEMRESDVTCDTSSEASGTKSGDDSESGGQQLHKYVQARSRIGQKCALCWSLHQEVRKVHTRCVRCGKHFCLSRFRNCMEEAHNDLEKMQQILDEEPS